MTSTEGEGLDAVVYSEHEHRPGEIADRQARKPYQ